MELEQIHKDMLAECAHDEVAVGHLIWRLKGGGYELDDAEFVVPNPRLLSIIKTLLGHELIEAGVFQSGSCGDHEFAPERASAEVVVAHIERAWNELGRAPQIGEVCWFRATAKGKRLAIELGLLK